MELKQGKTTLIIQVVFLVLINLELLSLIIKMFKSVMVDINIQDKGVPGLGLRCEASGWF